MPKAILEGYLNVTEAALALGKTEQTVWNWLKADKISYLEVSGKPFISVIEINRIKKDGLAKTPAEAKG